MWQHMYLFEVDGPSRPMSMLSDKLGTSKGKWNGMRRVEMSRYENEHQTRGEVTVLVST